MGHKGALMWRGETRISPVTGTSDPNHSAQSLTAKHFVAARSLPVHRQDQHLTLAVLPKAELDLTHFSAPPHLRASSKAKRRANAWQLALPNPPLPH